MFRLLLASVLLLPFSGAAWSQPVESALTPPPVAILPGDAAISGFSGVGLADGTLPPGVNPLDKTVITIANPSLKILDLSNVGGVAAGQLLPPNVKFSVPAADVGQVFGLAFEAGGGGGAAEHLRRRHVALRALHRR